MRTRPLHIALAFLTVGVVTGMGLPATPAGASHAPDTAVVVSGNPERAGWVAYKIFSNGVDEILIDFGSVTSAQPAQVGTYLYDAQRRLVSGMSITGFGNESSVLVDAAPAPGVSVSRDEVVWASGTGGSQTEMRLVPGGPRRTWYVLQWAAGRSVRWSHAIRGVVSEDPDVGVKVLAQDAGDRTFLYRARDFSGVAQAEAHALGYGGGAGALRERAVDVRDTLIAVYTPQQPVGNVPPTAVAANVMGVTTPQGDRQCLQQCSFVHFTGAERAGAGRYVFSLSRAGAGMAHLEDVMLSGLDARLPDETPSAGR